MLLLNPLNDLRRFWDWQNDEQMLRLWIRSATHGNGGRQLGESMRTDDARYGGLGGVVGLKGSPTRGSIIYLHSNVQME